MSNAVDLDRMERLLKAQETRAQMALSASARANSELNDVATKLEEIQTKTASGPQMIFTDFYIRHLDHQMKRKVLLKKEAATARLDALRERRKTETLHERLRVMRAKLRRKQEEDDLLEAIATKATKA